MEITEPDLLIPAIIAFTLLIIGLGLTIWEFYRKARELERGGGERTGDRRRAETSPQGSRPMPGKTAG